MQTARAAASDGVDAVTDTNGDEDAMKLSRSRSKKTVVTTKMVQRWSSTLSVSLVTLPLLSISLAFGQT